MSIESATKELLKQYADLYETTDFLYGDPSFFMHQVSGSKNQEAMAFIASCLSYGSRPQFMKKIHAILEWTGGDVDAWVRSGLFENHFRANEKTVSIGYSPTPRCTVISVPISTSCMNMAHWGSMSADVHRTVSLPSLPLLRHFVMTAYVLLSPRTRSRPANEYACS